LAPGPQSRQTPHCRTTAATPPSVRRPQPARAVPARHRPHGSRLAAHRPFLPPGLAHSDSDRLGLHQGRPPCIPAPRRSGSVAHRPSGGHRSWDSATESQLQSRSFASSCPLSCNSVGMSRMQSKLFRDLSVPRCRGGTSASTRRGRSQP
jgi:hypothetical protein